MIKSMKKVRNYLSSGVITQLIERGTFEMFFNSVYVIIFVSSFTLPLQGLS